MNIEEDLARILLQEQRLRFRSFTSATAWELGSRLRTIAVEMNAPMAFEIILGDHLLFACALPGTTPANADWIRRKRNTVLRFHRSSYAIGLSMGAEKKTLQETVALPLRDYSVHGGSFPLLLDGTGCVGTITASGVPQRADHGIVVRAIAEHLGIPLEQVALQD